MFPVLLPLILNAAHAGDRSELAIALDLVDGGLVPWCDGCDMLDDVTFVADPAPGSGPYRVTVAHPTDASGAVWVLTAPDATWTVSRTGISTTASSALTVPLAATSGRKVVYGPVITIKPKG